MAAANPGTELRSLGLRPATLRALAENGATVVGDLLDADHTRNVVAAWPGVGASRLADLDNALGRHGVAYGRPIGDAAYTWCGGCEICPDCGNPRAAAARSVAVDLDGRAGHLGHRVGPVCDGCDKHHRGLVAAAAAA
jgi:hypothetical protein